MPHEFRHPAVARNDSPLYTMYSAHRIFKRQRLLLVLSILLVTGFFATTLSSYYVSKQAIRDAIIAQELPLTSSNIYSEIQKDLVRPILISSTMSNDTFLRDWVLGGETDVEAMARYLREIKERYGAFSSFFVSERSAHYYTGDGILKQVSPKEPRDAWYYRVRAMQAPYEINVDPDLANRDALTIFINYRVFDFNGKFIGATGIGLTVDAVRRLIADYQQRYQRTIYFVDGAGKIVLFGNQSGRQETDLRATEGLRDLVDRILQEKSGSYQFTAGGDEHLLNVNYIPELQWYLFVEKGEDKALANIRQTLYINLAVCLGITLLVLFLTHIALTRYQRRIEEMAATDKLTGLLNRQAFSILIDKAFAEYRRDPRPISVLLLDVDRFKSINDQYGHIVGDRILSQVAARLQKGLRASDIAVRWGGEEFLVVLKGCALDQARQVAEQLRQNIEQTQFDAGKQTIPVTLSIGVSQYDGEESYEESISRADAGLYAAKSSGRNRVCVETSA
jgi:diguanylate cyclase (GGDEF)-like protein